MKTETNSFLEKEIKRRKKSPYSYNIQDLDFLRAMNDNLYGLEKKLTCSVDECFPNVFILGLPRAGTTLLSQLIFNGLNFACTNNLMARFWKTPLVGSFLSKIVLGDMKPNSFESDSGKTSDIYSPHEFSWFWHDHLKMDSLPHYDPQSIDGQIDWQLLKLKILNMNRILEKGIVFKPLEFAGYHAKRFNELFKKALFIYIERNSLDIALSLAKTRLTYYDSLTTWWGSYPLEYDQLKQAPYWEQIAGQIYYLREMYRKNFSEIDSERLVQVSYKEICENPARFLISICDKTDVLFDYKLELNGNFPVKFSFSSGQTMLGTEVKEKLKNGLRLYDLI